VGGNPDRAPLCSSICGAASGTVDFSRFILQHCFFIECVTLESAPALQQLGLCLARIAFMSKTKSLSLLLILSLISCVSATGQQALPQEQTRQATKVRKKLAHFVTGTKLDVQLSNGSHHPGKLSDTGSANFVLVDPVSGKAEAIDYQDVKRVQPVRKEYIAQQIGKTANSLPRVAGIALLTVAAVAILFVVVK